MELIANKRKEVVPAYTSEMQTGESSLVDFFIINICVLFIICIWRANILSCSLILFPNDCLHTFFPIFFMLLVSSPATVGEKASNSDENVEQKGL
jgi:hypothetical protein